MDISIRRNEICVIGLPRCDLAFSGTRSCFIAYGYGESTLEMSLLRKLLEERGIQAEEASANLTPGESAFCGKICSKIITAQFCVVILNNDLKDGREIPNANVNMEYGLMLGFNKCVIPFQKEGQKLPFNVAGLDTVKYGPTNFEEKAISALDQAIESTKQDGTKSLPKGVSDPLIQVFFLARNLLMAPLDSQGEKDLFRLGEPMGFNFLNDFSGEVCTFFGGFASLRPEHVIWRIRKLDQILCERRMGIDARMKSIGKQAMLRASILEGTRMSILEDARILVCVTSQMDKEKILNALADQPTPREVEVVSMDDIQSELAEALQ